MATYSDAHRALQQAFLNQPSIPFPRAQQILAKILSIHGNDLIPAEDITQDLLRTYVRVLNSQLTPLDFEILEIQPQAPTSRAPEKVYILTNTSSDAYIQIGTRHTPADISFFKRILDAIFVTNNTRVMGEVLCVSRNDARYLAKPGRDELEGGSEGLTMREAEGVLDRFVEEGWLEFSESGYYSLGARAVAELGETLLSTYNVEEDEDEEGIRVRECMGCKQICTVGQRCADRSCGGRLHDFCAERVFRNARGEGRCMVCKKAWDGHGWVGERVKTMKEGRGGGGGGRRRVVASEEEEEEEEEEERPRRNWGGGGRQRRADTEEDEDEDEDEDAEGEEDDE